MRLFRLCMKQWKMMIRDCLETETCTERGGVVNHNLSQNKQNTIQDIIHKKEIKEKII